MSAPLASYDVLVLGAGLAGLRAAIAAREAAPGARVAVLAAGDGPSGSSFANLNGRLGILAPEDDAGREAFVARTLELAPPGRADPALVRVLAEQSAARTAELERWGAALAREPGGGRERHTSCFLREARLAVLLTDLPGTFALLAGRAREMGVEFLSGLTAFALLREPGGPVCGAACLPTGGGAPTFVAAGAVVAALGGPARLFERTIAGPGPGCSYGLLAGAGAALDNAGRVQFLWSAVPGRAFFRVQDLARPGAAVARPDGAFTPLPPEVAAHAASRATHCPMAHGLPDAALDRFLAARLGPDGTLAVRTERGRELRVAPHAQCGNGGARIDADGATTVPGLFAAGECATGMHGADRVGGAMVAATLVFGARAGAAAARLALAAGPEAASNPAKLFTDLINSGPHAAKKTSKNPLDFSPPLAAGALPLLLAEDKHNSKIIEEKLTLELLKTSHPVQRTALVSALTVVRNLHMIA